MITSHSFNIKTHGTLILRPNFLRKQSMGDLGLNFLVDNNSILGIQVGRGDRK